MADKRVYPKISTSKVAWQGPAAISSRAIVDPSVFIVSQSAAWHRWNRDLEADAKGQRWGPLRLSVVTSYEPKKSSCERVYNWMIG